MIKKTVRKGNRRIKRDELELKKKEECENKVMNCLQKRAVKEENEKGRSEMARSIYEEKIMQEKDEYILIQNINIKKLLYGFILILTWAVSL